MKISELKITKRETLNPFEEFRYHQLTDDANTNF